VFDVQQFQQSFDTVKMLHSLSKTSCFHSFI